MTEDQIKQNATNYIDSLRDDNDTGKFDSYDIEEAYIKGAHSRDEEIEKWKNLCDRLTIEKWQLQEKLHNLDN